MLSVKTFKRLAKYHSQKESELEKFEFAEPEKIGLKKVYELNGNYHNEVYVNYKK